MSNSLRNFFILLVFIAAAVFSGLSLAGGVDYSVKFAQKGAENKDLAEQVKNNSLLVSLAEKKPANEAALRRRAHNDVSSIETLLQEKGYFSGSADYRITKAEDGSSKVEVIIEPGEEYHISDFEIEWEGGQIDELGSLVKDIKLPVNETITPEAVLTAEKEILKKMTFNGYPFPESSSRKLILNHEEKTVKAVLVIIPGEKKNFGPVTINSGKRLKADFIERRISWKEGDLFDMRKVNSTRRALLRSGVISYAEIEYPDQKGITDLPVSIDIKESKHRTIGAGASYSTSYGPIAQAFWEHRNLLGRAEKFRVRSEIGTTTYSVSSEFNKPDLWENRSLSWLVSSEIGNEKLEAYEKTSLATSTWLNYQFIPSVLLKGGFSLEWSRIQQKGEDEKETFSLLGLPMSANYDGSDNLLNPRKGLRAGISLIPYTVTNESVNFLSADLNASYYIPFGKKFVWANRARYAVLLGASRNDIPADKRLYAGGGGSVRGYGSQMISPLDEDNDPGGGKMLIELGTEMRYMVSSNIEAAAFYEGAKVTKKTSFSSDEDFMAGAGIGLRYHSPAGPIRADFAIPLDKRKDIDDAFQIYVSLGQAF